MLWKLLKYDFRAMGKQFSLIWLAALAVALINRFALPWQEDSSSMSAQADSLLALITAMTFVAVLAAMFITGMIFVIQRFYKGLLGDEGYLMHTLPVATWQLVISKFLCALAVTVLNGVVAVAAVVGYICIRLLKMIADKGKFGWFAYYCWAVGLIVLALTLVLK